MNNTIEVLRQQFLEKWMRVLGILRNRRTREAGKFKTIIL